MTNTPINVIGNLTADPEIRFTPSGAAVANFTVASTPRRFDRTTNEWVDGETLFLNCSVWREQAENVADSLERGMRVIVSGRLKARSYETREGEKRTVFEVDVEEVGPSMRYATAKVTRRARSGGGNSGPRRDGNDRGPRPESRRGPGADPWDTGTSTPRNDPDDPWSPRTGSGSQAWDGAGDHSDEPPF